LEARVVVVAAQDLAGVVAEAVAKAHATSTSGKPNTTASRTHVGRDA
jgi:hypothetical protein